MARGAIDPASDADHSMDDGGGWKGGARTGVSMNCCINRGTQLCNLICSSPCCGTERE